MRQGLDDVAICGDVVCHVRVEFRGVPSEFTFPALKLQPNCFQRDRCEVPDIHADITPGKVGQLLDASVAVAVEVPGAVARGVPDGHAIVAHDDQLLVEGARQQLVHLGEVAQTVERHLVVVSRNEDLLPLETSKVGVVMLPGEVSDDVDEIVSANGFVPVGDDGLVHLLDRREWTPAMPADVVVAEMEISGEEGVHGWRCSGFDASAAPGEGLGAPASSGLSTVAYGGGTCRLPPSGGHVVNARCHLKGPTFSKCPSRMLRVSLPRPGCRPARAQVRNSRPPRLTP